MNTRRHYLVALFGLGILISFASLAMAIDGATLGSIRIALLNDSGSDASTINEFKRALTRQGWEPTSVVRDANLFKDAVDELRGLPEFELVVVGIFPQPDRLSLTVYWEDGERLIPSTPNQPFNDVVAEFVEFVQGSTLQDYIYERRQHAQRSSYEQKLEEAWAEYRKSKWSQSQEIVLEALTMPEARGDWQPHFLLGHCCKNLEQFEKAREAFETTRRLKPDHPGAVLELGNLEFSLGDFSKAKLWYAEAIERGTSNLHRARWNLALVHQILREWDEAKKYYEMLLQQPAYSMRARTRILEIDAKLNEINRIKEQKALEEEQRARLLRWLRGVLGFGGVAFATAWVVVLQRRRQKDDSVPPEKKAEFTSVLTQALVGVWSGLLTAFAMTFLR